MAEAKNARAWWSAIGVKLHDYRQRFFLRAISGSRADVAGWKFLHALWKAFDTDDVLGLSAQISFYFVLSMFPFLILVTVAVDALRFTQEWNRILAWFVLYLPLHTRHLVLETITALPRTENPFLTIGIVGTVWAATSGIMSLAAALNVVYNAKETRGYLRRLLLSCLILIALTAIFLVLFALLTVGGLIDLRFAIPLHLTRPLLLLWHIGRWILSFVLTALSVALIDNLLPNHGRSWRWVMPGSAFTVAAWLGADAGFNFYFTHVGNYQRTYGVLAGFIVLMIWIYVMGIMVLVGAEINSLLTNRKTRAGGLTSSGTSG